LEAFAQLGTELDPATQAQLDRGARMVELLKQDQYQPVPVVDQVMAIYAGSQGFFDKVPTDLVGQAEAELVSAMRDQHPEVRDAIKAAKVIDGENEQKFRKIATDVIADFMSAHRV
ncbi:MAG: F0F1 ATP synthase subunit alpha, partial [Gemmatimonadetes bacterium]|nr:F0F1 ATP synthase subunit alpha [Gemmatimonadota bacterium]